MIGVGEDKKTDRRRNLLFWQRPIKNDQGGNIYREESKERKSHLVAECWGRGLRSGAHTVILLKLIRQP